MPRAHAIPRIRKTLSRARCLPGAWEGVVSVALILVLLFPHLCLAADSSAGVSSTDTGDVAARGEEAKDAFRRRMNPPAPFLALPQIVEREETRVVRAYALRAFEGALDALQAEAGRADDAAQAVETALRKFVTTGKARAADALFADITARETAPGQPDPRRAATAVRYSVALVDLPEALAPMIKRPGEALPLLPTDKALQAYRRAAALDPNEPWTWLAIAWMVQAGGGPADEAEAALDRAQRAAFASGDVEAAIASLQTRGRLRAAQRRLDDARRALAEAVKLSEMHAQETPDALENVALSLGLLGDLELRRGDMAEAASAFERSFKLRRSLAAAAPGDETAQLNVAASQVRLALLAGQSGRADEARHHFDAAFATYHDVASRHRFLPTLDAAQSGPAAAVFVLAGVLTLGAGIVLLARYRRAVDRLMKAAASASREEAANGAATPVIDKAPPIVLAIRSVAASGQRGEVARSVPLTAARRALRRAAAVQIAAGAAFAAVATALMFRWGEVDYAPVRAALIFWSWAWPVVVVLQLLWGRDRMRTALVLGVYFGGLLLICVVVAAGDTPPLDLFGVSVPAFVQPLVFWAQSILYSLFLLFFLNRRVRSVGPVLLVFLLIASIGGLLAQVVMSTYAGTRLMSSLGLPVEFVFLLVPLLGMIVFALPAWWVIGGIRHAYQAKQVSDVTLMFDAIWLFQALILCESLIFEAGLTGWIGLGAFAAYTLVAVLGARWIAAAAMRRPAARLLLLRVFGFRARTERLFDVLAARWRFAGPIQMIAAPDLAARTIDPGEFIDFLSGRLRRRFIIEPGDLQQRLAGIDLRPDADGRFRVNDIFCGNDTWQAAVASLMAGSDLVAMDLRGFTPQNKGCVYELQVLIESVPAGRIVVLADRTTDLAFLQATLAECARAVSLRSPNRASRDPLTILEVGNDDPSAVQALLAIADVALAGSAGHDRRSAAPDGAIP